MSLSRAEKGIVFYLILLVGIVNFSCQAFENIGVGVRAIGMGEAFTAISDDASGPYWNPAGLTFANKSRITAAQSDLFDLGLMHNFVGITVSPLKIGIHYEAFTDINDELGFKETTIKLAKSFQPKPHISIGLTINKFKQDFEGGNGDGYGFDLGFIINSTRLPNIRYGVSMKNAFSQIKYNTGTIESLAQELLLGACYISSHHVIGVDINKDKVNLGIEKKLSEQVCVRFGYNGGQFSLGLGAGLYDWQLDFALTKKDLGMKNILSITKKF